MGRGRHERGTCSMGRWRVWEGEEEKDGEGRGEGGEEMEVRWRREASPRRWCMRTAAGQQGRGTRGGKRGRGAAWEPDGWRLLLREVALPPPPPPSCALREVTLPQPPPPPPRSFTLLPAGSTSRLARLLPRPQPAALIAQTLNPKPQTPNPKP